jgi:hypothetical protein
MIRPTVTKQLVFAWEDYWKAYRWRYLAMLQWNQRDWDSAKMPLVLAKDCPTNRGLAGRDSTHSRGIQCILVATRQETLWTECLNPGICMLRKECCKCDPGGRNNLGALYCRIQSLPGRSPALSRHQIHSSLGPRPRQISDSSRLAIS